MSDEKTLESFSTIKSILLTQAPNIIEILNSDIRDVDKADLLELYEIYICTPTMSEEARLLKLRMKKLLKKYKVDHSEYKKAVTPDMEGEFKKELDSLKNIRSKLPTKYRITSLNTTIANKRIIYERYKDLLMLDPMDDSYPKLSKWVDRALSLPYDNLTPPPINSRSKINKYLCTIKTSLDRELYGMENVKEQLLLFITSRLTNPDMKGCCLGLIGNAGTGKCLGVDTPIIMYNGSTKMVQNIVVGDILMGDDSKVRHVKTVCSGRELMYRIDQEYGDSYTVNESHILSLKLNVAPVIYDDKSKKCFYVEWYSKSEFHYGTISYRYRGGTKPTRHMITDFLKNVPTKGDIIDIPVKKYINRSSKWKNAFMGFKTGVEFKESSTEVDPYILGLWLGSGDHNRIVIPNRYKHIIEYVRCVLPEYNRYISVNSVHDHILDFETLRNNYEHLPKEYISIIGLHGILVKFIPLSYKANNEYCRLTLLAGIIDGCGKYDYETSSFMLVNANRILCEDIMFMSRSLGFVCNISHKDVSSTPGYVIRISGNISKIPVLYRNRVNHNRKPSLTYNIKVHPLKVDTYYGFEIDGNRRFLLGDFTVTHNTAISRALSKVMDIPFHQVSFGGVTNPDYIKGHEYTYVGSQPGEISRALASMKYKNGILFFDEYDKVSDNKPITSTLLHITDPVQNHEFKDSYFSGITQDLSNLWFMYSMNYLPKDPALRSRLHVIKVKDYTDSDKIKIAINFFVPNAIKMVGLKQNSIILPENTAKYLINRLKEQEKGVRQLKFVVTDIVKKINFIVVNTKKDGTLGDLVVSFSIDNLKLPVTLTDSMIDKLLLDQVESNDNYHSMYC